VFFQRHGRNLSVFDLYLSQFGIHCDLIEDALKSFNPRPQHDKRATLLFQREQTERGMCSAFEIKLRMNRALGAARLGAARKIPSGAEIPDAFGRGELLRGAQTRVDA